MNRIHRHIPGFVEGTERSVVEFSTLQELFAIPWIDNFSNDPEFHRFSIALPNNAMMAEYLYGDVFYVVGYLDEPVDLPVWKKP